MIHEAPSAGTIRVETHGVDAIPEREQSGRPRDVVNVLVGTNLCFGVIIFGWLPVSFGLGFWPSVASIVVGTLIGTVLVAPLALISMRTRTNLSTSSGAHFGVRGRLLGSGIGLLLSLGYTALTLWTGGDAVVGSLHRLVGLPDSGPAHAATYAVIAGCTVVAAIYGFKLLVRLGRWLTSSMTVLLVLGLWAYSGDFSAAWGGGSGGDYLLGGFWATWLLAVVAAGISGPVAFITILGDYTRYLSPARHSPARVLGATSLGLVLGLLIPQLFGTFTAVAAGAGDDFIGALVAAAPTWFLLPLAATGVFGSIGNGGLLLYSMGLDLDAIVPRLSRLQATIAVGVLGTILVFAGHFAWNALDFVTAFVLMLVSVGTPWAVITLIGFLRCRGRYDAEALQVYNRRSRGGIYWFTGGWNLAATTAWTAGALIGLLAVDTTFYQGPLLSLTGGVDFSFLLSGAVTTVAYLALTALGRRPRPHPGSPAAAAYPMPDARKVHG
ncbi:purine-cytosine permease family protein [Streptomyces sp. FxanaC1]|uniref:purine-cytosine permease family protein n=1 Tax=Streptomyces sp. FxanaC1 TaxID=1157640 RepID=UPI0003643EC7|nr:cytosine permease [Streptomyces sp. SID8375]